MSERADEERERWSEQLGAPREWTDDELGRLPMTGPRRFLRWSAAVLFVGLLLVFFLVDSEDSGRAFDPEAWRTADTSWNEEEEYPRRALADGLVESGRLTGMARPAVVELLGEPFETWRGDNCDVYRVGPDRGWLGIDEEFLIVDYGVDGRVEEVERFVL